MVGGEERERKRERERERDLLGLILSLNVVDEEFEGNGTFLARFSTYRFSGLESEVMVLWFWV